MTKRSCYQCGEEDLDEVQQRRKTQVRAWADEQIAEADRALHEAAERSLTGVPQFEGDIGVELQEIPVEQKVPTEEEAQAKLNDKNDTSKNDADLSVDATALGAQESGDPVSVEEAKEEVKAPAKKATAKKTVDKD